MTSPSKNPTYKLSYFEIKYLAEPIRYLFAYGNIDFEDVRISRQDYVPIKPSMPFGLIPVLEVDGIKVHQSIAICRYLAKRIGLAGSNDWENLLIDMVVDSINDFRTKIADVRYEQDKAFKEKKRIALVAETLPFYFDRFEKLVNENNGYLAIGRLSWADFYFAGIIDYFYFVAEMDIFVNHPGLQKWLNKFHEIESIKAWIAKRPVSVY